MIHSIRLRIALMVLAAIVGLQLVEIAFVLNRVESAAIKSLDDHLIEELAELELMLKTPQLEQWAHESAERSSKWTESFYEVRDGSGRVVSASPNLPAGGLPAQAPVEHHEDVRVWEMSDPGSRSGHRKLRVAERSVGELQLRVAQTMRRQQKAYWSLREKLAWSLLVISAFGAAAAWLVATRALLPVRRISARARELGVSIEGELPRSGSGDELDQLAGVLNDLLGRVRVEMTRVRRLTADAGHALRTPLTALRGHLELALQDAGGKDADLLEGLLADLDQLIRLVNELLLLESLDATKPRSGALQRVDLGRLAGDLVEHLRVLAGDRDVELKTSLEAVPCRVDAGQIRQALANLIDNALRHTPSGGRVDVEVRAVGDVVELSVQDTGPGLCPDDLERVFERFYTSPASGGTGLGLSIARAIARAHGGELRASSPGGARFVLELPLEPPAPAD